MRILSFILISLIIAVPFSSCEKEYFKPAVVDPNTPVSFKLELEPLFASKCAISGCHNGALAPNLMTGKSYSSLVDGLYVDTLNPSGCILMTKLNTNMPPGNPLPQSDRDKVLNWIKQGAKDN